MVDDTDVGGYVIDDLREVAAQGPFALSLVAVDRVPTFQKWQELLLKHQQDADAIALGVYHSLRDERSGDVVPPDEVAAWTNSVNTKLTWASSTFPLRAEPCAACWNPGTSRASWPERWSARPWRASPPWAVAHAPEPAGPGDDKHHHGGAPGRADPL